MRDTGKILRHAIFSALNGNLSYSLINIPVYDEKLAVSDNSRIYVLLSTQQETNEDTMDSFLTRSFIDIEVCHRSGSEVSKDIMDDIGNDMLDILLPDPYDNGITDPSGFQITNLRRERSITRMLEVSATESVLRKIITISAIISHS